MLRMLKRVLQKENFHGYDGEIPNFSLHGTDQEAVETVLDAMSSLLTADYMIACDPRNPNIAESSNGAQVMMDSSWTLKPGKVHEVAESVRGALRGEYCDASLAEMLSWLLIIHGHLYDDDKIEVFVCDYVSRCGGWVPRNGCMTVFLYKASTNDTMPPVHPMFALRRLFEVQSNTLKIFSKLFPIS
jgi:hypothetical protein